MNTDNHRTGIAPDPAASKRARGGRRARKRSAEIPVDATPLGLNVGWWKRAVHSAGGYVVTGHVGRLGIAAREGAGLDAWDMWKGGALLDAARGLFQLVDEVEAIQPTTHAATDDKERRTAELVCAWTDAHGPLGLVLRDVISITTEAKDVGLPRFHDVPSLVEQRQTWFYAGKWWWLHDDNDARLVRAQDAVPPSVSLLKSHGALQVSFDTVSRAFSSTSGDGMPIPFTDAWWLRQVESVDDFVKAAASLKALHDGLQEDADEDDAKRARALAAEVLEARRQVLMADGSLRFAGKTLFDCIGGAIVDEVTGANSLTRCVCGRYFRALPSTKRFHDDNCEQKHRKRRRRQLAYLAESLLGEHSAIDARRRLPKHFDGREVTRADKVLAVKMGRALVDHRRGTPWATIATRLRADPADVASWLRQCSLEEPRARRRGGSAAKL